MSSAYSSNIGSMRCRQCGASLALNDARCGNCGYDNGVPGAQNAQSQAPNQRRQVPPQEPQGQMQAEGLLRRYPAPTEQRNVYAQPPTTTPPQAPTPQVSFGGVAPGWPQPDVAPFATPAQPPQGGRGGNGYDLLRQSGQLGNTGRNYQNVAQPASAMFSSGAPVQSTSGGGQAGRVPQAAYAQPSSPIYQEPVPKKKANVGRIVGIILLLIAVLGGSFLGYTFLFADKNSQAANSTTTPSNPTTTTPKGNPLFQDAFTNNTNGWSVQSYPGEFSVALGNGALRLENDNNKLLWELVPGGKSYGDFQLSVDATLSQGTQDNGYGVYIRGALSQNMAIESFYRFELYGDGSFAVFKGVTDANGATTTPRLVEYTNSSAIQKQGTVNHITIAATGTTLQFSVNGQTLSTVSDTTYTNGSVALFVSNLQKTTPGAAATFAHLAIYPAQK